MLATVPKRFLAPLAGALLASTGMIAQLVNSPALALVVQVNVDGVDWDVTFKSTSYSNDADLLTGQTWWGSGARAESFANAVGASLGVPNDFAASNFGLLGPLFTFAAFNEPQFPTPIPLSQLFAALLITPQTTQSPATATVNPFRINTLPTNVFYYATATPTPSVSVPGPMPVLGVIAAFGFSRKLRKRIKASAPEVISTTAV